MILGVGMISLAELFPLGLVRLRDTARSERAAQNLNTIAAAMHKHHDQLGRFPTSLAEILLAAGYPKSGNKDDYKIVPLALDAASATLANQPIEPGVHGMLTAVLTVSRASGKPVTQVSFTSTPGADLGRRLLREKLLDATAQSIASLIDLLPASEQAYVHSQILPYIERADPQIAVRALSGPDGKVTFASLREWLVSQSEPSVQPVLAAYWERIARDMQLDASGQNWSALPGVSMATLPAGSPVFSFATLSQLTTLYVATATLRTELLGYVQSAEQSAAQGLLARKEDALKAYAAAVRRNLGVQLSAAQGSTLLHIAQSL